MQDAIGTGVKSLPDASQSALQPTFSTVTQFEMSSMIANAASGIAQRPTHAGHHMSSVLAIRSFQFSLVRYSWYSFLASSTGLVSLYDTSPLHVSVSWIEPPKASLMSSAGA